LKNEKPVEEELSEDIDGNAGAGEEL